MTRPTFTPVFLGTALTALLLLSACGKHEPAAPASHPAASASTAVPAAGSTAPSTVPAVTGTAATPAAATTAAVAATPAAAAVPLTVAKLTLGDAVNNDHQVSRAGTRFSSNDKSIYASVATEGSSSGVTLNARWSYLEGPGQLVSTISQAIATDGPAVTTFKVQNPELWPEGKYQVEILLDGKPVAKQGFEIARQ
ncbi:MAG: hypothetical protein ACMG50_06110 [Thermomonas sp.]